MTASTELAWAAGFFDGEGCTSQGDNYPVLKVSQVDPRPLERFHRALGLGAIRGPYVSDNPRHQPKYQWASRNWREAFTALDLLRPYLSAPKLEQAAAVAARWEAAQAANPRLGRNVTRRLGSPVCGRGHPASETVIQSNGRGRRQKVCRACVRQRYAERKAGLR